MRISDWSSDVCSSDLIENSLHDAVLINAGRFGFERQDDAMAQYVKQNGLDVLGADEVAAGEPGVGTGAAVQGDGAPRAGAVGDPFGHFRVKLEIGRAHV